MICHVEGRDFSKIMSLPLLLSQCSPFIFCCGEALKLVFRYISRGIDLCVAEDLVCPWEVLSSGSFYSIILNHPFIYSIFTVHTMIEDFLFSSTPLTMLIFYFLEHIEYILIFILTVFSPNSIIGVISVSF